MNSIAADPDILSRHLKKTTLVSNIVSVVMAMATAMIVVNSFYYNTNNTLNDHHIKINESRTEINALKDKVNDAAVFQGVSKTEIQALKEKVNSVEIKVDKMNDKLDKILMQTK